MPAPAHSRRAYTWIVLLGVFALLSSVFMYDAYIKETPDFRNLRTLQMELKSKVETKKAIVKRFGSARRNSEDQGLIITLYVSDEVFADTDYCQQILKDAAQCTFDTFRPEPYRVIVGIHKTASSGCKTQDIAGPEKEFLNERKLAPIKLPSKPKPVEGPADDGAKDTPK